MSGNLYKYISPHYIDNVFQTSQAATLKCSLPRDFNDPYELFLTIDFNEKPDALAFYADAIGEIPQHPTTCFSRSPAVVPMWAHYANNQEGFVIEFSQEKLVDAFPECSIGDVIYSDIPHDDLTEILYRAYVIGKMRYTYMLRNGVFNAAYFTKASCWSYEQECRMILNDANTRKDDALTLIDAPNESITSIICGPRASKEAKRALADKAEALGCRYLDLRIEKSSAKPYFVDANGEPSSFDGNKIEMSSQFCETCKEPLTVEAEQCSWCQINDELRRHVASRNPFRILDRAGLLESYVSGMDAITEKHLKGEK